MKKLYISKKDRKIFGVCGGIGETYDIDPTLIRLIVVFLCLASWIIPLLLTYPQNNQAKAQPPALKTGYIKWQRKTGKRRSP